MRTRRIGFGLSWVVLFIVVFAVQIGHQYQLNSRAIWMEKVDSKLDEHAEKLNEITKAMGDLPEAMIRRFKELPE